MNMEKIYSGNANELSFFAPTGVVDIKPVSKVTNDAFFEFANTGKIGTHDVEYTKRDAPIAF